MWQSIDCNGTKVCVCAARVYIDGCLAAQSMCTAAMTLCSCNRERCYLWWSGSTEDVHSSHRPELLRMLCWQHRGCAQHLSTAATTGLRLRGSLAAQSMCTAAARIDRR